MSRPAPISRRTVAWAALVGFVAAGLTVVAVAWMTGYFDDDGHEFDGTIVLDQPGIYDEPADGSTVNADATGDGLPNVVLHDADDNPVDLATYRGQPLVINFWFSTCAPCRRELSDFADVHAEVGDRVTFIGVNPYDTVAKMQEFAAERGVTYDLLRDRDMAFASDIGLIAYPITLFVDAEGRVLRQTGELQADELRAAIDELFPAT